MALGGWGSGAKSGLDASDYYGRGYDLHLLRGEIAKIAYADVPAIERL